MPCLSHCAHQPPRCPAQAGSAKAQGEQTGAVAGRWLAGQSLGPLSGILRASVPALLRDGGGGVEAVLKGNGFVFF